MPWDVELARMVEMSWDVELARVVEMPGAGNLAENLAQAVVRPSGGKLH